MARVALACLLLAACTTHAPLPAFGPGTEDIVALTKEFNTAFTLRDSAAIERLTAPEYMFHYIDSNMSTKLQATPNAPRGRWAAEMFSKLSNGPLEWSLIDARVVGDTGFVVAHYRWTGAYNGNSFRYEGYMTDVWARRNRKWQLVVSTASLLPPQGY